MTTITLKHPVGLQVDISSVLKQISSKELSKEKYTVTKRYIGVEDNAIELLALVRCNDTIEIISFEQHVDITSAE